jgi:hypothetical protein
VELALPLVLSGLGVAIAALVYLNRDKPEWRRNGGPLLALAVGQVLLGVGSWFVMTR